MEMELKDFVKGTIHQLILAHSELKKEIIKDKLDAVVNPFRQSGTTQNQVREDMFTSYENPGDPYPAYGQYVKFEISVGVKSEIGGTGNVEGKAKIVVIDAALDVQGKVSKEQSSLNRIQFVIPVIFPIQDKEDSKQKQKKYDEIQEEKIKKVDEEY